MGYSPTERRPRLRRLADRLPRSARRSLRVLLLLTLEIATTLRAVPTLVVVEVMVRTMPLSRTSRLLGCAVSLEPARSDAERLRPWHLSRAGRRRLRCAGRVADAWPFSRGPCLRRALVGGHLVRELDPVVRLGTARRDGELMAHAWLEIQGRPLEDVEHFAMFHRAPRAHVA